MLVRLGDKVLCNACNRENACIGVIDSFTNWYGETVVTVYFEDKGMWDQCDREVFYLRDLAPVKVKKGKALSVKTMVQ